MNLTNEQKKIIEENVEVLQSSEIEALFNDHLNEHFGDCKIGSFIYSTSEALYKTDLVKYKKELQVWIDAQQYRDPLYIEIDNKLYLTEEVMKIFKEKLELREKEIKEAKNWSKRIKESNHAEFYEIYKEDGTIKDMNKKIIA